MICKRPFPDIMKKGETSMVSLCTASGRISVTAGLQGSMQMDAGTDAGTKFQAA